MEELLTVKLLSLKMKVSQIQVYRLMKKGLPFIKVGNNTRFLYSDVLAWLKEENKKEKVVE